MNATQDASNDMQNKINMQLINHLTTSQNDLNLLKQEQDYMRLEKMQNSYSKFFMWNEVLATLGVLCISS